MDGYYLLFIEFELFVVPGVVVSTYLRLLFLTQLYLLHRILPLVILECVGIGVELINY